MPPERTGQRGCVCVRMYVCRRFMLVRGGEGGGEADNMPCHSSSSPATQREPQDAGPAAPANAEGLTGSEATIAGDLQCCVAGHHTFTHALPPRFVQPTGLAEGEGSVVVVVVVAADAAAIVTTRAGDAACTHTQTDTQIYTYMHVIYESYTCMYACCVGEPVVRSGDPVGWG